MFRTFGFKNKEMKILTLEVCEIVKSVHVPQKKKTGWFQASEVS